MIHHNEFFIQPLCHLGGLNAGQSGKRCLIAIVVFLDVVDKWNQYALYSDYHIVKYYMIILIKNSSRKTAEVSKQSDRFLSGNEKYQRDTFATLGVMKIKKPLFRVA
ncbi:hypothetical protein D4502_17500 [Salmonella enterica subsp. enterica serovar Chester]|nr:hypothetical protein [Salmonella enterica subsp. enterica serovar Chester]